jgi:type II secretory pathway predicted ATPase ExeA
MYEEFFGLRERPFDLTPNPRYLVLTESHREALSNLQYGIASRKGITLLVGEAGSGKTTVIRTAIALQPTKVHCVHLHNPMLSRDEFVMILATHFGLSPDATRSKAVMLLELESLLDQRRARGETTVLVVDEAQSLPNELLEEIRLLINIETNEDKLLSVIIAGQPEIVRRLNDQSLRQLKQRIALRCELRALSQIETAAYLAGRIRAAGGLHTNVFTYDAVATIHERAQGLPRTISVIADNALLGGFAAGQRPVGSQIVLEVCRDFDFGPGPTAPLAGPPPPTAPPPPIRAVDPPAGRPGERPMPSLLSGARTPASRPGPAPAPAPASAPPVPGAATAGTPASGRGDQPADPERPRTDMFSTFLGKRKRFSFLFFNW